jgi:hypothetical protein
MHKEVEGKSLVELAPSYEVASAYLVHMLEARFANLNPFLQYIFLNVTTRKILNIRIACYFPFRIIVMSCIIMHI